jgi:LysM repeat protein
MQSLKQASFGLIVALVSVILVLGGASLSLAESRAAVPAVPTATGTPIILIPTATLQVFTQSSGESQPVVDTLPPALPTDTNTPIPTNTLVPPTNCPAPAGWVQYQIQSGDDLTRLATTYRTTADGLVRANCLGSTTLIAGSYIFVPPVAAATATACRPPAGWVRYIIRPGDTLYQISLTYGITVLQLQQANCMANPNIVAGKTLFVPPWATVTPPVVPSPIPSITPSPTATSTETPPPTATDTATATLEPTATSTPVTPSP